PQSCILLSFNVIPTRLPSYIHLSFFFTDTPTTAIYTLSLHDALPISLYRSGRQAEALHVYRDGRRALVEDLGLEPGEALQRLERSEEHTSELQSRFDLVCRLLLEKKKKKY